MRLKKEHKKNKVVWTCDYCEQEFVSKNKSDAHELICIKNPKHRKIKKSKWMKVASISRIIWFFSMVVFGIVAVALTNSIDKNLDTVWSKIILIVIVTIGVIAFILMSFSFAIHYSFSLYSKKSKFEKSLRFIGSLVFLPIIIMRNIGDTLFGFFILLPMWIAGFFGFLFIFGLISSSRDVIGSSMNPTIIDKEKIKMYSYSIINKLISQPQKGDIVIFSSGRTANDQGQVDDYVKRVVATAGDEVEIRDGYFYLNGQIVKEPYTAKPRSTFGAAFLGECKKIVVPNGYIFVMGDNRKLSKDSRELGFVSLDEINSILPVSKQDLLVTRQRDASKDGDGHGLPSFNIDDYYTQINKIRTDNKLKPLNRNEKLEKAALARAKSIVENNEVGKFDKQTSKYPYNKAIKDAGYNNIVIGEVSTTGYYDAQELANYWMEYETKENLLDKRFQDIGLGVYVGKIDGCEVQVIINEFGGYVPPNYSKATIEGWRNAVNNLNSIIPNWEQTKNWPNMPQDDLNKLLGLLYRERTIASNILGKMESGKWLSSQEDQSINEYNSLIEQSSSLANKLNSR